MDLKKLTFPLALFLGFLICTLQAETADNSTNSSGSYTVKSGDTYAGIARKFGVSVTALKKANSIRERMLIPRTGRVLEIPGIPTASSHPTDTTTLPTADATPSPSEPDPSTTSSTPAPQISTSLPKTKTKHKSHSAADNSDVASSPTLLGDYYHPPQNNAIPDTAVSTTAAPPTPVASTQQPTITRKSHHSSQPQVTPPPVSSSLPVGTLPSQNITPASSVAPLPRSHGFLSSLFGHDDSSEEGDWAARFHAKAEELASHHIGYAQSWRPPGEAHAWVMDCSNTSRYLYRVTANLELPRTASDQYYYLHLQGKAWDVPTTGRGDPDVSYLQRHLKPGDLLFWENTYRPDRQPPITHVMVFLGQDELGHWLMAGSQSGHNGEHKHTGPDIYHFDPLAPSGGYTTWMGLVRHKGRFVAFGRPLSADPAKLASN
jgi:cell wall-associated NlpC family hydrolase